MTATKPMAVIERDWQQPTPMHGPSAYIWHVALLTPECFREVLRAIAFVHAGPTEDPLSRAMSLLAHAAAEDFQLDAEIQRIQDDVLAKGCSEELRNQALPRLAHEYGAMISFVRLHSAAHMTRISARKFKWKQAEEYHNRCLELLKSEHDVLFRVRHSGWGYRPPEKEELNFVRAHLLVSAERYEEAIPLLAELTKYVPSDYLGIRALQDKITCLIELKRADDELEARRALDRSFRLLRDHKPPRSLAVNFDQVLEPPNPWLYWD